MKRIRESSSRTRAGTAWAATILALITLVVPLGCGGPPPGEDLPGQVYTVRGMVRDLPNPDRPGSEFSVRHEAIDDFVSLQGEVIGMSSMTMPFPLADKVSLDGVAIGDPVEVILKVDWDGDVPVQVTSVKELPPDTQLEFRKARPPAPRDP